MYKLLVVDDERVIRQGIVNGYDWQSIGISHAYSTSNSFDAEQLADELQPRIVISDICMPQKNGLELVGKLLEKYPMTKIIILSGYDEFAYAQEAIRIGVFEYLLKPAEIENIVESVKRAIAKCKDDDENQDNLSRMQRMAPLVREKMINEILSGRATKDIIYELEIPKLRYTVLTFRINYIGDTSIWEGLRDFDLIKYGVKNILEELAQDRFWSVLADTSDDLIAMIVAHEDYDINQFSSLCVNCINNTLEVALDAGIGRNYENIEQIADSYEDACGVLKKLETVNSGKEVEIPLQKVTNVIEETKKYINNNLAGDLSLSTMAKIIHLTPQYFTYLFKREVGEKYCSYVTRIRMECAKELLKEGECLTYEVGMRVGFEDSGYFSKVFKKYCGITPSEYKAHVEGDDDYTGEK